MIHDIISDILEADTVPAAEKSRVIDLALDEMQDSTRNVMTMEMWWNMAEHMGGIAAMGGPATGLLPPPPAAETGPPTRPRMRHHETPNPSAPRQPRDSSGHEGHRTPADSVRPIERRAERTAAGETPNVP